MSKLTENERLVLCVLCAKPDEDFPFLSFAPICEGTKLDRKVVRRACRSLARKGLAEYERGLWNQSCEPCGAGDGATAAGKGLIYAKGEGE